MPSVTDWLMVVITAIYVVATIAIFVTNKKSEKAAYAQLEENRRQYEDKKRLEIMPYVQFERTDGDTNLALKHILDSGENLQGRYILVLRIKNIGNGTAKDISYSYQWNNLKKSHDIGPFIIQALSSGESQVFKIDFAHSNSIKENQSVCFIMRYCDLLDNAYSQKLSIKFECTNNSSLRLSKLSTSAPVLLNGEKDNA